MMAGATQFSWIFTATVLLVLTVGVKCKRKFDGDFEFAEEVSPKFRYDILYPLFHLLVMQELWATIG